MARIKKKEPWYNSWRSFAAYVYLAICITDFILMPIYYENANQNVSVSRMFELSRRLEDGDSQVEALRIIHDQRVWKPLTLDQSGMFHIAFGAILGVSAWSRGKEKNENNSGFEDVPDVEEDYPPVDEPTRPRRKRRARDEYEEPEAGTSSDDNDPRKH